MVKLTEEQILMLQLSDKDIEAGRLISQEMLDELDRRLLDHQNGIGRTYTWEETITMADQALAERKKNR